MLTQLRYNSGVALLFRLELLLERGQTGEPHVGHLVLVLGVLVEVDAALRAQALAIGAA